MNIFVLDNNPEQAVKYLHNSHVVKMTLETAQLICTAQYYSDGVNPDDIVYRKTHYNHPCSIWARESQQNYNWLCSYGYCIAKEYEYRYGRVHKSYARVIHDAYLGKRLHVSFPFKGRTPFALAMPDKYKTGDSVESYRNYYIGEKLTQKGNKLSQWKKRDVPAWAEAQYNEIKSNL